jgi:CubicO group peptidase (beta-lactamase class C family)
MNIHDRALDFTPCRHSLGANQRTGGEPADMMRAAGALKRLVAALALMAVPPAVAAEMPPGIPDPDKAILDPAYNDPVLFWRVTSAPRDIYEPDPYFYWPEAKVAGAPAPFFKAAGRGAVPAAVLEEMAGWAEARKSNALIVVHRGRVLLERYWNGTGPETLLNGRAITRSMQGLLLGFAVTEGKLTLDDRIGRYLTEWDGDRRGDITIRQLAQHVSGLEVAPDMGLQILGNKDLCLAYCGDVVRAALAFDYARPPGERFEVAQENMQLLSIVIERAMGVPFQTLLSERVWTKIGAADATFQFDRPNGVARTMCCFRATARDYVRLGVMVAQDGVWAGRQVLPRGWVKTMATPSAVNPNYGLGLWRGSPFVKMRTYFEGQPGVIPQSEPYLADDVVMMEGGGFRIIHMVPSEELVIFRHGPGVPDWDGAYLVNAALRGMGRK